MRLLCNITKVFRWIRWPGEKSNLTSSGRCCRSLKRLPGQPVYLTGSGAQCCETAGQLYRQSSGHRSHQRTENYSVGWARLNIASLLTALDFKPYQLHDQNERTPIGGKIVFQRWHDSKANRDLMKIEYVYQSAEQLRNADALTLQAPAQRVTLELSGCPIDADGFCPMDKFDSVLNEAVK